MLYSKESRQNERNTTISLMPQLVHVASWGWWRVMVGLCRDTSSPTSTCHMDEL